MKKIVLKRTLLFALAAALIVIETLNFTGFCYSEGRYFTPEQIKYRITTHEWRNENPRPSDAEIERRARANDKLDCCSVRAYAPWNSGQLTNGWLVMDNAFGIILDRLFGFYNYEVLASREEPDGSKTADRFASFGNGYVDACGNPGSRGFSEPITKERYVNTLNENKKNRLMEEKAK